MCFKCGKTLISWWLYFTLSDEYANRSLVPVKEFWKMVKSWSYDRQMSLHFCLRERYTTNRVRTLLVKVGTRLHGSYIPSWHMGELAACYKFREQYYSLPINVHYVHHCTHGPISSINQPHKWLMRSVQQFLSADMGRNRQRLWWKMDRSSGVSGRQAYWSMVLSQMTDGSSPSLSPLCESSDDSSVRLPPQ